MQRSACHPNEGHLERRIRSECRDLTEAAASNWSPTGQSRDGVIQRVHLSAHSIRKAHRIGVDPSSHNTNPPGVFGGPSLEWLTEDAARSAEALDAVSRFIELHGQAPTQDSWTAAGMSPCERTVRARFGSFRAAAEVAGLTVHP